MYKRCEDLLKELEIQGKIKVWRNFEFPQKEPLKIRLKDILEDEVDEKYYLSDEQVNKIQTSNFMQEKKRIQEKEYSDTILARDWKDPKCVRIGGIFDTEKSKHQAGSIYDKEGLSPTLDVMQGGWRQPSIIEQPKIIYEKPLIHEGWHRKACEVLNVNGITTCIHTQSNNLLQKIKENSSCRIRKLTPKEYWRLMAFSDEDFEKAQNVPTSNTQLYKQARKFNCC